MKAVLLIVVFALVAAVCFFIDRSHRRQLVLRMEYRLPMNDNDFARLFPANQAFIAIRIRQLLQKWVDIDLSRMAPTDEFCHHLGLGRLDGLDVNDFVKDVEKEFHVRIPDSEGQKMRTFKEMVEFVASAEARQQFGESGRTND